MSIKPAAIAWADRHHGLITFAAWREEAGCSPRSWYRALDSGLLLHAQPLVARLPGAPRTPRASIAAAVWSVSGDALASHRSAALLWGADVVGDDPVDLVTTKRGRTTSCRSVALHRPTDVVDLRRSTRDGIAVCNPLRCLADLGAVAPSAVLPALESFMIAGFVSLTAVRASLARHRGHGRAGAAALAEAIDEVRLGNRPADSLLETTMARLLDTHRLTGWAFHRRVAGFEVDFAFIAERVVIEVDGWLVHAQRDQFQRDRRRDAELVASGWVVLRFTWLQVTRRPGWVVDKIRTTLSTRRCPPTTQRPPQSRRCE